MNLIETEKVAVASIITNMMCADYEITFDEHCYFEKLKDKLSLTDDIIDKAKKMSRQLTIEVLKESSYEVRKTVAYILKEMSTAGEGCTTEKVILLRNVCIAWNLPLELIFNKSSIEKILRL
ncbi:hypothetical protein [Dysgonomonas sp. ZJ279]|uniref:hypothetical protein n=1 Tax=Dysgonomonas sp. ZJ279 TaxID=2709796 RepID=UPI0013E9C12D|nr:hypothetical protein [Dysgonomonas sp. ZJ279]